MSFIMYMVIIIVLALIGFHFYQTRLNPLYKLPGPKLLPFVGYSSLDPLKLHITMKEFSDTFGRLTHFAVIGIEFLFISDTDLIHQLLVKHRKQLSKGPQYEKGAGKYLGHSVLISKDKQWSKQRALLKSRFSHAFIDSKLDVLRDTCREFLDATVEHLDDEEVEVKLGILFRALAMRLIGIFSMGVDLSEYQATPVSDNEMSAHFDKCMEASHLLGMGVPEWIIPQKMQIFNASKDVLQKTVDGVLQQMKSKGVNEEEKDDNLMSWMIYHQSQKGFEWVTDEEIRNEILTLLFAGSDTTANSIALVLRMLAENSDVLSTVVDEFENLNDEPQSVAEYNQAQPILNRVIQETLRLWPSAPGVGRYVEETINIDGLVIPKGTNILVSPYVLQRDRSYWGEDADDFNPDRFAEEKEVDDKFMMPFLVGNRVCLGRVLANLEMNIVIPMFLRRFSIRLPNGTNKLAPEDLEMHVTFVGKKGLPLLLEAW